MRVFFVFVVCCVFLTGACLADNCKGTTKDGKKEGVWTCFYENGKKQEAGPYKAGIKEGKWSYFHENGVLAMAGSYVKGEEKGKWKMYDEAGKLMEEIDYGK